MTPTWTWHPLEPGRSVLELHHDLTPPGLALELEVLDGGGSGVPSYGVWRLSQTGMRIEEAGEA